MTMQRRSDAVDSRPLTARVYGTAPTHGANRTRGRMSTLWISDTERGLRAMEILDKQATTKGGPDIFTGDAWIDVIVRGEPPSRVRVNVVRFAPGARNAWHRHAIGQTVHVTEGAGRI